MSFSKDLEMDRVVFSCKTNCLLNQLLSV